MDNKEWVKKQFEYFKRYKPRYREALILISFIEIITRQEALNNKQNNKKKKEGFKESLGCLGLNFIDDNDENKVEYRENCGYKNSNLKEINTARIKRNNLLHDITDLNFYKERIDNIVKEMSENIELICKNSKLIRDFFKQNYQFDPAKIVE